MAGAGISVRDFVMRFGDRNVVDGLTFDIAPGEIAVIASPKLANEDLFALRSLVERLGITRVGFRVPPAIPGDEDDLLRGYWDRLSDGGHVDVPLEVAPWGDAFGQLKDRFGINWLVNIAGPGQGS